MSYEHRNVKSDNVNWQGGISRDHSLTLIPLLIARDGNGCTDCGTTTKRLYVHHIDENPKNNALPNLRRVCRSCHSKIHKCGLAMIGKSPANKRRLPNKVCICGVSFRPRNSRTRFCSTACRCNGHSIEMTTIKERPCEQCGVIFKPRHSKTRLCSQACFGVRFSARLREKLLQTSLGNKP